MKPRPFIVSAAVLASLLASGAALPENEPRRVVGDEVLRDLVSTGEARVLISLRPEAGRHAALAAGEPRRRVEELMASLPPGSFREARTLGLVPVAAARITEQALSRLREDPRVSRIDGDGRIFGAQSVPLAQVGADRVQALGFAGEGIVVAVLDSGTDPLGNVDLRASLDAEECFCSNGGGCCPDGSSRQSGAGSAASVTSHGPGVLGIITSDGVAAPLGVAPAARVVAVRVLDDGLVGTFADVLEALDWVLENRPDVRLVNMSLAAGPFDADCDHAGAFNEAVAGLSQILRARGGLMVAASGNHFSATRMGSPACVSSVVSVGAVSASDFVMSFSDASASLDLLAPGDRIATTGSFGGITTLTGTSAAAPHVTAAAALLLSASPDLSASELESRLESRGAPVFDPRNGRIYPRLDAYRALQVPAEVSVHPSVISARSRGRGIALVAEPHPPFLASDLVPDSFTVSIDGGPRLPVSGSAELGDADADGVPDLTLHADRRLLLSQIPAGGAAALVLEGEFSGGPGCRGRTMIHIRPAGGGSTAFEPKP
jgi:subtilisin family serine protease